MIDARGTRPTTRRGKVAAAAASISALAAAGIALAGPAAAAETLNYHYQTDVSGATIACGATQLTATAGSALAGVFHENADSRGEYHVTDTETPSPITLTDDIGNTYSMYGADWFGGTFIDPDGNEPVVLTSTDEFSITNATGGLLGKISAMVHLSPNGKFFAVSFGQCSLSGGS